MKRIIKAPNLPTKTKKCPHCGCEFTYTEADVRNMNALWCPYCHKDSNDSLQSWLITLIVVSILFLIVALVIY